MKTFVIFSKLFWESENWTFINVHFSILASGLELFVFCDHTKKLASGDQKNNFHFVSIKKIFKVYPKGELVIVDDNSTDNTIKIIKKFKSHNINLIQRKKVRGLASAFVVGMFNAKGNYIGWIDSNMDYVLDKFKNMEKL